MRSSGAPPAHLGARWCGLSLGCVLALLLLAARGVTAQNAPTCGWSELGNPDAPSTLVRLRARAADAPEWLPTAEQLLLRLYRECDGTAARSAARNLQSVQEASRSSDLLLLAWLGVALARGPDVQIEHAEGLFLRSAYRTSNAERTAARLLAQVTERTGWPEVAQELAAVGFATRKGETLRLASEAIAKAANEHGGAALWSALAEVELVRGERAGAERAAKKAAESGAPRAFRVAGILEMSRGSESAKGGADQYLKGLAQAAADDDVAAFYDDILLLLAEDELQDWAKLHDRRAGWIRRKWDWRAQMAGIRLEDRLAEHFRRLDVATARYLQTSFRGAPPMTGVRTFTRAAWVEPLDDRGLIYLRHGEPAAELRMRQHKASGGVYRLAWVYRDGPSSQVLEFDRGSDRAVYFLAEPTPICGQHHLLRPGIRVTGGYSAVGDLEDWAGALAPYQPTLAAYYINCWRLEAVPGTPPDIVSMQYVGERRDARLTANAALESESAMRRFDRPLSAGLNLYAFHAGSMPELVGYLWVGADALRPGAGVASRAVDLDVLFSVGDPVTEQVVRLDTALTYTSPSPLPANATLHFVLPVRTPAFSDARVTVTLTNRADRRQGQVLATTKSVPGFSGALMLSDLVVGQLRTGTLTRGQHRLAPVPGHAIMEGDRFRLYYERYGTRAGDPLSVSITVLPAREESLLAQLRSLISQRRGLSVSFEEQASPEPDGTLRVERDLSAELLPGAYSLLVTVRNQRTQESAMAETNLRVLERG